MRNRVSRNYPLHFDSEIIKQRAIEISSDSGEAVINIAESAELVSNFEIEAENLVQTFELGLAVGVLRRDRFIPLLPDTLVQVGERIRVQLEYTVTVYL